MNVQHTDTSEGGAFYLEQGGTHVAELTYRRRDDGVVVADHTFTDPSLRGQGTAGQLLAAFMAWVEQQKLRVVPQCSYVARAFDKNPAYAQFRA